MIITLRGKSIEFIRLGDGCLHQDSIRADQRGRYHRPQVQLLEGWPETSHLIWEATNGPVPLDKYVLHTCDDEACCELSHLYLGGASENAKDIRDRGFGRTQKLTWKEVNEIRSRYSRISRNGPSLAREYGITHGTLYHIINRRIWIEHPMRREG